MNPWAAAALGLFQELKITDIAIAASTAAAAWLAYRQSRISESQTRIMDQQRHIMDEQNAFARDQAKYAPEAIIAANRPWVKVTAGKVERLEVQADQVSVWITFEYQNAGRSPAQQVSLTPRLLIPQLEPFASQHAKQIAAEVRGNPHMVVGDVLFPDDKGSVTANFGRPMNDIIAGRRAFLEHFPDMGEEFARHTGFSVAGCLSYRFGTLPEIYQTTFAFDLKRAEPETRDGMTSSVIDTGREGVIDGSELELSKSMLGWVAT